MLREHPGAVILVTVGVALRVLMMIAYRPAFWFWSDSGSYIRDAQKWPELADRWPFPGFLHLFEWTGSFYSITAIQHLAGVLLAVASYVFLRRMGVGQWIASLAMAPLLLDATQITLEHYLLTETLFTTSIAVAALLLVWREKPGIFSCVLAGVLVTLGWQTRPTGLPVALLLLVFLILRTRSWRQPVAYLLGVAALFGVVTWSTGSADTAMNMRGGAFLYARTAHFADCDRLHLRDEVRRLCPTQPLGHRPERADWYMWAPESPGYEPRVNGQFDLLNEFAHEVIKQQPGDYLREIARESTPYFTPGELGPDYACLSTWWKPPLYPRMRSTWESDRWCQPFIASPAYQPDLMTPVGDHPELPSRIMHKYGEYAVTPPWGMTLAILVAFVGGLWPRRGNWRRLGLVALMYVTAGFGIMIFSVATSMFDHRYGLPALAFVPIGAAIGWHHIRSSRKPASSVPEKVSEIHDES